MIDLVAIAERAVHGVGCTRDEAQLIADAAVKLSDLYPHATRIREAYFGTEIDFCAIVNARSGNCSENCRFCAQSAHHQTGVDTYPLKGGGEILNAVDAMADEGVSTFGIVTSGETVADDELDRIGAVAKQFPLQKGVRPCASLGRLSVGQLRKLRDWGLMRYHHNLETSRRFYREICTTHDWDKRLQAVMAAQEAGLQVCCGGLFGLGETWEDRIDLALTLRELGVQSVPVNFLNPVPGTPLGDREPMSAEEGLRIIALYRFMLPAATIRVCGGRPLVLGDRQEEMFAAGANALMTGDYLTTNGITPATDRALVERLGLTVAQMQVDDEELSAAE